jgi:hypothetical protein
LPGRVGIAPEVNARNHFSRIVANILFHSFHQSSAIARDDPSAHPRLPSLELV